MSTKPFHGPATIPSQQNDMPRTANPRHSRSRQMKLIDKARASARVCPEQLGVLIYGSKEEMEKTIAAFKRVDEALSTNNLKLPCVYRDLNRQQMLLEGLRGGKASFQDAIKYNHNVFDYATHHFAPGNANPFGLTMVLFVPFLKLVGTDEQVKFWCPLAESGQIIGSYAQTEMAHGSHVSGIETTATFDYETEEFIINSPGPGAMGFCSSHTILMARLIIDAKDHGVHPFMVQIRSLVDFKPMPGIELGDMGLKLSYNGTDNGYAIFNHVRIPRTNLLSRYAAVSRTGNYSSIPLREKMVYGSMLNGRVAIVRSVAFQLAKAVTIATRYSVVREQGSSLAPGDHTESAIIAYKHQHYRLLTLISQAYAILFASQRSKAAHLDLLARQMTGDHSTLPSVHALMCGLKAWSTQTAADGAEEARKMCGGHGYLTMSGLPEIVALATGACTFEGDNWIMWGQVARYLMKGMDAAILPADMTYIDRYDSTKQGKCHARGKQFLTTCVLTDIFKHRAARLIREAHVKINGEVANGSSLAKAMNKFALDLTVAARSHIELYILEAWIHQLDLARNSTSTQVKGVVHRMIALFALTTIASPLAPYTATFISDRYFSYTQIIEITGLIDELLKELLPEIIALTDAFFFTDGCLNSAIGCKDGDIYRRLMTWTKQLPINVEAEKNGGVFKEGWEQYIKPFLDENKGLAGNLAHAKL